MRCSQDAPALSTHASLDATYVIYAIMNMAKLKAGAFPTTRGELASIVDGYKAYAPDNDAQESCRASPAPTPTGRI